MKVYTATCRTCESAGIKTEIHFVSPQLEIKRSKDGICDVCGGPIKKMQSHHEDFAGLGTSTDPADDHNFFDLQKNGLNRGVFSVNVSGINTYRPKRR